MSSAEDTLLEGPDAPPPPTAAEADAEADTDVAAAGDAGAPAARSVVDRVKAFRPSLALLIVGGAFVLSRIALRVAGVTFDVTSLEYSWQLLDRTLLARHPFESVWYLHTQPPLFNLFVGVVLRVSPFPPATSFHLLYLGLGVALAWGLYDLARRLGAANGVAIALTVVVLVAPETLLYENWLSYEYPVAVGLVLLANVTHRYVASGRLRPFVALVALASVLVLTRSILHPLWLLAFLGIVLLGRRPASGWRPTIAIALVPFVLCAGWMLKNQALFGSPTLSSWSGMNIARTTTGMLPGDTRAELIANGTLHPVADVKAFQPYAAYAPYDPPCKRQHPNVPELSAPVKSNRLYPNFNDECFLPLYDIYQKDAIASLRTNPGSLARGQITSYQQFLRPGESYGWLKKNNDKIAGYSSVFSHVVFLQFTLGRLANTEGSWAVLETVKEIPFLLTMFWMVLVMVYEGGRAVLRWRRDGADATNVTLTAIAMTTLLVTVVGNLFEIGENMRFRYMIEPFLVLVFALWLERVVRRATRAVKARGSRSSATPVP